MSDPTNDGELVCNLCYPTLTVYGEVLKNWVLAYSDEARRDIPEKHYALFNHFHEPIFVWPQKPIESPVDKYGDEESEKWSEDDERFIEEDKYIENVYAMEKLFQTDIMIGYCLVNACIKSGYKMQNSGMPLFWLTNRMARLINKEPLDATYPSRPEEDSQATETDR